MLISLKLLIDYEHVFTDSRSILKGNFDFVELGFNSMLLALLGNLYIMVSEEVNFSSLLVGLLTIMMYVTFNNKMNEKYGKFTKRFYKKNRRI